MPDLYIIKLGGSVITEKSENRFEVRKELLAQIGSEIKKALAETKATLILVHGAGPFGHTNVAEYRINDGVYSERQKEGYAKTVKDCNFLDNEVVGALKKAGVKAIGFDPNKIIVQENKKIVEFDTAKVEGALKSGKVPVLFGQMVPDKKLNASVVSGDAILAFLAKKMGAKKVLLGTDVAGIFTADPKKDANAERIPVIDRNNFGKIAESVKGSASVDVTGGMKGKLEEIRMVAAGSEALIFNANEKGSFYKALSGQRVKGTVVRL